MSLQLRFIHTFAFLSLCDSKCLSFVQFPENFAVWWINFYSLELPRRLLGCCYFKLYQNVRDISIFLTETESHVKNKGLLAIVLFHMIDTNKDFIFPGWVVKWARVREAMIAATLAVLVTVLHCQWYSRRHLCWPMPSDSCLWIIYK